MAQFCFDTSAFMEPWNNRYPPAVFPSIWERLVTLTGDGTIISPEEVYRELVKQDDDLSAWAKTMVDHDKWIYKVDADLARSLQEILAVERFAWMLKQNRNAADPWVVALARITGRTVVTEETRSDKPEKNPKLPNVCDHYGIPVIRVVDFLREMGWSF